MAHSFDICGAADTRDKYSKKMYCEIDIAATKS